MKPRPSSPHPSPSSPSAFSTFPLAGENLVSEPPSEGKENQQEEAAAATATPGTRTPAAPATAGASEKCPRAPESCVFPAGLRAWGSGADWGGVEPHRHPVTCSGLQQQSKSRLSHEECGLGILRGDPSLPPTSAHHLIQLSEEEPGQACRTDKRGWRPQGRHRPRFRPLRV